MKPGASWTVRPAAVRLAAVASILAAALAGCGDSSLSADSTCRQYVAASPEDREVVVSKLAQKLNAPNAAGLGRPNIDNACEQEPDKTLGVIVKRYATPTVSTTAADEAPSDQAATDTVLEALRSSTRTQVFHADSGFQLFSLTEVSGPVRDAIAKELTTQASESVILPDGVTADQVLRLLDQALILASPSATEPFCHDRVVSPTDSFNNEAWSVTFPPDGMSNDEYRTLAEQAVSGTTCPSQ